MKNDTQKRFKPKAAKPQRPRTRKSSKPLTFLERYGDLVGCIKNMPADFAEQHDHYIHGTPKRKKNRDLRGYILLHCPSQSAR